MDQPFLDDNMQKYICAYIDGEMDSTVVEMFEVYLDDNPDIKAFVKDAQAGKEALHQLRNIKKP
jgi:anti-sigma factor RsiW